jgi:hypothetical protein
MSAIMQGEVEAISLMKPKAEDKNDTGLLEYLEDIIGSNKYITQIEEEGKRWDACGGSRLADSGHAATLLRWWCMKGPGGSSCWPWAPLAHPAALGVHAADCRSPGRVRRPGEEAGRTCLMRLECHVALPACRLEEMNEKRQGMIAKLKAVEKEVGSCPPAQAARAWTHQAQCPWHRQRLQCLPHEPWS